MIHDLLYNVCISYSTRVVIIQYLRLVRKHYKNTGFQITYDPLMTQPKKGWQCSHAWSCGTTWFCTWPCCSEAQPHPTPTLTPHVHRMTLWPPILIPCDFTETILIWFSSINGKANSRWDAHPKRGGMVTAFEPNLLSSWFPENYQKFQMTTPLSIKPMSHIR